jgi:3-phosphoshikimate 1-carboxyvinyltransferase
MDYPSAFRLFQPRKHLEGRIALERSKSISNRVLIIRELTGTSFPITHLSAASDTRVLEELLAQFRDRVGEESAPLVLDAGAGGTTFRFLTAFLAFQPGVQLLTGDARMKERPVGPLVEALRQLGARIDYAGAEGFPPLLIRDPDRKARTGPVRVDASVSSQFISALMLVGPALPGGLELVLEDTIVSRPYIEMTLALMRRFGVEADFSDSVVRIPEASYQPRAFEVEADWTAASYFYAFAALKDSCDLFLEGLSLESVQGDAMLAKKMGLFGIETTPEAGGLRLERREVRETPFLEWDFLANPDLAQTISVLCAAKGVLGLFSGLETLRVKETDRVEALKAELQKVGVWLTALPGRMSQRSGKVFFQQEGQARWDGTPHLETYGDHRMAMALSVLGCVGPVRIANPGVVQKSYPRFWEDLAALGFVIEPIP